MSEKPMTVSEMARMGGRARAGQYSKARLRAWGKQGGRPPKLTSRDLERMKRLLAEGRPHGEIAQRFGVSLRTVGRVAAEERRAGGEAKFY